MCDLERLLLNVAPHHYMVRCNNNNPFFNLFYPFVAIRMLDRHKQQQDGSSLPVTLGLTPGIQPRSLSGLPSDGLEDRGKSESNTLFYWIPEQARE